MMYGNVKPMSQSLEFSGIVGGVINVPIVDPENHAFVVAEDSSETRIARIILGSSVIVEFNNVGIRRVPNSLRQGGQGSREMRELEEGREIEKGENEAFLPGRGGGGVQELGYGNKFAQGFLDEVKNLFFLVSQVFEDSRIPFFPESPTHYAWEKVPCQINEELGREGGVLEVKGDEDGGGITIRGLEDKGKPIPNDGGKLILVE